MKQLKTFFIRYNAKEKKIKRKIKTLQEKIKIKPKMTVNVGFKAKIQHNANK